MILLKDSKTAFLQLLFIILLFSFLLLFVFLFLSNNVYSYSSIPYSSYIYNFWGNPVPSPQAYIPARVIDINQLGAKEVDNPRDIFVGPQNNIYLLDTNNDRILIIDENWQLKNIIKEFKNNGERDVFNNPQSIFVDNENYKYIADTENRRIVVMDQNNELSKIVTAPDPDVHGVIPEDFTFRPNNLVVDNLGNMYVISQHVYEGILEFDSEGTFRGFIGAPEVAPSPADLLWRQFATEKQRDRMALFLPTEYNALDIDNEGFIFAVEDEVVRRLSPTGENVLRTEGFWEPQGDIAEGMELDTNFIDITARGSGIYSILETEKNRIFTYDQNSNLLYIFGGPGYRDGLFLEPVAIDSLDDKVIVLDRRGKKITVFSPTDYAIYIHQALYYYNQGRYELTKKMWENVLSLNTNYDLAYSGLGSAYLRNDNYQKAMINYRLGNNRSGYSSAFRRYRQILLEKNFGTIIRMLLILIVFIILLYKFDLSSKLLNYFQMIEKNYFLSGKKVTGYKQEHKFKNRQLIIKVWQTLKKLYYSIHVIFHPVDGYWDLKHEKKGSLFAGLILLLLVSWTYFFMKYYTGFIFNYQNIAEQNLIMDFVSVFVPFILWCIVNWALTTLMEGKGTFKEIFIATSYSLVPIILINIPITIISNYLTSDEGAFFYLMQSSSLIWAAGLVFLGTKVTHEYPILKTVLTCIAIIIGIATVLFIGLLFFSLLDLMGAFLGNLYLELIQF